MSQETTTEIDVTFDPTNTIVASAWLAKPIIVQNLDNPSDPHQKVCDLRVLVDVDDATIRLQFEGPDLKRTVDIDINNLISDIANVTLQDHFSQ